ncbi:hypothetical protein M514_06991 [Trichuris suis]|uniref:Uncharacterized protein n=1 Tax=Trichuris suis TaxID=68888 RepID=A0A085M4K0_9BILA|nr:hypothetical protein M513_06991 [Trichuris suis]KFD65172.1 hypothetical protein M514_06991 [Trichuris suis]
MYDIRLVVSFARPCPTRKNQQAMTYVSGNAEAALCTDIPGNFCNVSATGLRKAQIKIHFKLLHFP